MWKHFLRGPWTSEEDYILLSKILEVGMKWSEISKFLNGRTENSVKNRYKSLIKAINNKEESHPYIDEQTDFSIKSDN